MTDYKQLMTDYKQLCAELLSELENAIRVIYREDGTRHISSADPVIAKADAALAEPEPEGLSSRIASIAKAVRDCAFTWEPDARMIGNVCAEDVADLCSAALTHWGRPAPEPVPEGPTDEELLEVLDRATADFPPNHPEAEPMTGARYALALELRKARAVLARWGRQSALASMTQGSSEVPRIGHILRLAEIIREVDGNHDKGAAALAEAILSHPGIRSAGLTAESAADGPAVIEGREPASVAGEPSNAEVLAARPLLERVAAMGDCIGVNTVGEIMAISDRAAAWLAANPPGNPIAIEPRGCPTPGACSCVQPEPEGPAFLSASLNDDGTVSLMMQRSTSQPSAESEPEGLTNAEIHAFADKLLDGNRASRVDFARAAIAADRARWGRRAPEPPADGEVAELVRWLRSRAGIPASPDFPAVAAYLTRAADLLERLASPACLVVNPPPEAVQALKAAGPGRIELMPADPPQPVPVSERLPGPEDCTTQGWCWVLYRGYSTWTLESPFGQDGQPTGWSHWLPAHALPLPQPH